MKAGASPYLNPYTEIDVHTHRLPHWQQKGVMYFVTWHMADSLPRHITLEWADQRDTWMKHHPAPWDHATREEYHSRFSRRLDEWLDSGHGSCVLREGNVRCLVSDALQHFHHDRYELDSFIVMPNHVHVLFQVFQEWRLEQIIHSWKRWTAREINRLLHREGAFWQEGYWDRITRNENHLLTTRRYIRQNPVKAHLSSQDCTLFEAAAG